MLLPMFSFVLEELEASHVGPRVRTKPMFGCRAIYVDEKIVFILRYKADATSRDNGVWIAIEPESRESLLRDFPTLRPIEMFQTGGKVVFDGWRNLPAEEDGFEACALEACRLVIEGDLRIGKIPKPRKAKPRQSKRAKASNP